jgi:hypothetical protein
MDIGMIQAEGFRAVKVGMSPRRTKRMSSQPRGCQRYFGIPDVIWQTILCGMEHESIDSADLLQQRYAERMAQ